MGRLLLEFCGESHVVEDGAELGFGREADLEIDSNPYLHRLLGRFVQRGGHWWLDNLGSAIALQIHDLSGSSSAVVAPGRGVAVGFEEFRISFTAGTLRYEMEGSLDDPDLEVDAADRPGGQRTLEWGVVELTPDQRLVLAVMCEPMLLDPLGGPADPPPNRACAHRLGWTLSKFTRKLDHLCLKFSRSGVEGVHGDYGAQAVNRRRRLVEHCLAVGLIGTEDLALLEPVDGAAQETTAS